MQWLELDPEEAGVAGAQRPTWAARAIAGDGEELTIEVYGERPGKRSRILRAVRDVVAPNGVASGTGPADVSQATWLIKAKGRAASAAELLEATTYACQGSAEWWALPFPWRADLELPANPEAYVLGGVFIGPVPPGTVINFLMPIASPPLQALARG